MRNHENVLKMIWNDAFLSLRDRDYIRHVDDLITFEHDAETSWVHKMVGLFFNLAGNRIKKASITSAGNNVGMSK